MLRLLWTFCVTLTLTTSTDVKKSQIGKEDVSKNNTIKSKPNEKIQVEEPRFEYLRLGDFINPLKKKYPREVTKLIFVTNGGSKGDWQRPQFCPKGTYAAGYEIKLEDAMWFNSDDTALNAVSLKCVRPSSKNYEGLITSMQGSWGVWKEPVDCVNPEGQNYFLVGFNLKVEKSRGIRDDTAANDIKFVCRLLNQYRHYQLSGKGGPWGKWGDWSERCPMGSAVCGIQVKMQEPQGPKDDTSLNDIRLFCCKDEQEDNHPSREEWIKLCDVKVQTGPGGTARSPGERNGNDGRHGRERFDSKGNRIWPPVDKSKSGEEEFVGNRSPPNYRRADSVYPGLQEDMDGTEVLVHDFH